MNLTTEISGLRGPVEEPTVQQPFELPGSNSAQVPLAGAGHEFSTVAGADLSAQELALLSTCKSKISHWLDATLEAWLALTTVRDQKLYRQTHDNFEAWCRQECNISSRRARQLCAAGEMVRALELEAGARATGSAFVLPANERQVRPLSVLPLERRFEAWDQAVLTARGRPVTERHVRAVVNGILGKDAPFLEAPKGGRGESETEQPGQGTGPTADPGQQPAPVPVQIFATPGPVVDVKEAGTREDRLARKADDAIREVRELMDMAGTADSVQAVALTIALQQVEGYREHLVKVGRLQKSRRNL